MRVAVLVEDYPSERHPTTTAFVHSRSLWYARQGVDVAVVSFRCSEPYTFEGIPVGPATLGALESADVVASHAPNVRNHVRLLRRCHRPTVFFFHGFEVLRTRRYYPRSFAFQRTWADPLRAVATDAYDVTKLAVIDRFLASKRDEGSSFVFVSEWMREQFVRNLSNGATTIAGRAHIIPNAVHDAFVGARYKLSDDPAADFVTMRANLDQPKYAIDVVVELARQHAHLTFHVYGRGELPRRLGAPLNLTHYDTTVRQADIPSCANRYRCALIPSRLDAQGVTACEMATFGIPTIVSDIPVARDVLGDFANVGFVREADPGLPELASRLWSQPVPETRADFLPSTTCAEELRVLSDAVVRGS